MHSERKSQAFSLAPRTQSHSPELAPYPPARPHYPHLLQWQRKQCQQLMLPQTVKRRTKAQIIIITKTTTTEAVQKKATTTTATTKTVKSVINNNDRGNNNNNNKKA